MENQSRVEGEMITMITTVFAAFKPGERHTTLILYDLVH